MVTRFQINRSQQRLNSFTLIELLVVIAIIAILAAMLLPALGTARDRAKLAGCQSQEHQLYMATTMYCDDNNRIFPNGDEGAGWGPGATASGYYYKYDQWGTSIYDGDPSRHVWRGLTVLWGLKYVANPLTLVDPGWQNDQDSQCISYNGKIDFSAWYPTSGWNPSALQARTWSYGTYVIYTQCGRTPNWSVGQAGIGGDGSGASRRLGDPVSWNGQEVNKAVLMCRMGKPSWPNVGSHRKQVMNVAFDDGRVVIVNGIQKHLQDLSNSNNNWGNEQYYISSVTASWWRWATVQGWQ